ncbi:hypothetical protein FRC09_001215 [Ceratobasidium sp. 395]|nr:hypothetical protein FRC09_001215 [Ceratobasidium sp. 395]
MVTHEPNFIPLDILFHVAKHTPPSSLVLLLQLNRVCHHFILPTLYRSISLRKLESILALYRTILNREHLRGHLRTLNIQLLNQDVDLDSARLLRAMLELVPNLTDLTLLIPPPMIDTVLLSYSSMDYPFRLKRFFAPPIHDMVKINSFLHWQRWIEVYGLVYNIRSSLFDMSKLVPDPKFHKSGLLPYLRQVIVPWPLLPGLMLNRSVTRVDIRSYPLEPGKMGGLKQLLQETSVPLESLKLGVIIPLDTNSISVAVNRCMVSIIGSPSQASLKDLTIGLWQRTWLNQIEPWPVELVQAPDVYMPAPARAHVSEFPCLESFQLEIEGAEPVSFSQLELTTTCYSEAWKKWCPNLVFLSLYGSVNLYAEARRL